MSRNGSGTYSLPAGNPVVSGTTITTTWANNTLTDIANTLTGSVASDGQTPMTGSLNMGSNKIIGLGTPTLSTDAVTKAYADALVAGGGAGLFTSVTDSGLTTGRVTYATTGGLLTDSATFTYDGTTVSSTKFAGAFNGTLGATTPTTAVVTSLTDSGLTTGRVTYATTAGLLTDSANLTFNGTTLTSTFSGPINGTVGATTANTGSFTSLAYTTTLTGGTGIVNLGSGQFYKDASGNVIIGTTAIGFAEKFRVYGNYSVFDNGTYTGFIGAGNSLGTGTSTDFAFRSSNAMAFLTGGATERMRIDSSGNVGIGTSSPSSPLDVVGNTYGVGVRIRGRASDNLGYLNFVSNAGSDYSYIGTPSANALAFYTNGYNERMRIDSSGNLLVGKTTASETTGIGFVFNPTSYSGATPILGITSSDTTSATDTYHLYSTGASAFRFYVDMAGTIHATSIAITAISDERLKENIKDIDIGLDAIMALKPRRFDWKEGKGQNKKNAAGFIAQEFETVFPESIGLSKAGGDGIQYKNINHETLIPTLVKAIQELKAEIDLLKGK